ncbi:ATP-grasp fold amidoligase family protein [Lachnospiraceae bacterium 62-26]
MGLISKMKKNKGLFIIALKLRKSIERLKVNRLKNFSDEQRRKYIGKLYVKRTGLRLDWNKLEAYTEKMQWIKLYDATDMKAMLTDKYSVRNWVKNKIGEEYLVPLIGVWNDFEEINFNNLPCQFVLKVTNGSGTNIIVRDKRTMDKDIAKEEIQYWMNVDKSYLKGFEMHYTKIRPKIIAEAYIDYDAEDLPDYKFLCFNGKVLFCWVDVGRYHEHKRNIYDLKWNLQSWNQHTYGNAEHSINKPVGFDKMVELAEILCEGFIHVRVDFYNVNGKIYFGEMTFTNGSGFELITPLKYNKMLGDLIELPLNYTEKYQNK